MSFDLTNTFLKSLKTKNKILITSLKLNENSFFDHSSSFQSSTICTIIKICCCLDLKEELRTYRFSHEYNNGYNTTVGLAFYPKKHKLTYELIFTEGHNSIHPNHKKLQLLNFRVLFEILEQILRSKN